MLFEQADSGSEVYASARGRGLAMSIPRARLGSSVALRVELSCCMQGSDSTAANVWIIPTMR
jgi:hypothetical protein